MQARGLVERRPTPTISAIDAVLTGDRRRVIEQAAPLHVESVRRHLIDRLTDEETETLGTIAEKVIEHLGRDDERDQPEEPGR